MGEEDETEGQDQTMLQERTIIVAQQRGSSREEARVTGILLSLPNPFKRDPAHRSSK
jgi:hypothetical protein